MEVKRTTMYTRTKIFKSDLIKSDMGACQRDNKNSHSLFKQIYKCDVRLKRRVTREGSSEEIGILVVAHKLSSADKKKNNVVSKNPWNKTHFEDAVFRFN